jgi:hypothetical protein
MMLRVMTAVLSGIVVASVSPAFGQAAQPNGAEPARRPALTKPTPEAKIQTLKPLPLRIVGSPGLWMYDLAIADKPIEQGEVVAIADGVVTLREMDKYFDVALTDLRDAERATIERMTRLFAGKGTEDENALIGSWSLYLPEDDDPKSVPPPEPRMKLFVSGSEIQLSGGTPSHYRLDSTKSPKVIRSEYMTGIYEFKSGWLRVRFGISDYVPKSFEGKDDEANDTLIFRPLPEASTLPPAKDLDPELKATFEQLSKLLENGKYDEFLDRAIPPQAQKEFPPAMRAEFMKVIPLKKDRMIKLFQAAIRVPPKISAGGSSAQFDFSRVHVDGIGATLAPKAAKIDGKWYLANF